MAESPEPVAIPMLGITSDPLPMPSEMFTILGEIVILWSRIEGNIDQDTTSMMQWQVIRNLVQKFRPDGRRPTGFKQKLELWRRCVRALYPTIAAYQASASEFQRAAKLVAKLRNHIIHGSWGLQPTEYGGFPVFSVRPIMETAHVEVIEVTVELLTDLLNDMRTPDNHIVSFVCTKMWHAHAGLLTVAHEASPPDQDHPSLPSR